MKAMAAQAGSGKKGRRAMQQMMREMGGMGGPAGGCRYRGRSSRLNAPVLGAAGRFLRGNRPTAPKSSLGVPAVLANSPVDLSPFPTSFSPGFLFSATFSANFRHFESCGTGSKCRFFVENGELRRTGGWGERGTESREQRTEYGGRGRDRPRDTLRLGYAGAMIQSSIVCSSGEKLTPTFTRFFSPAEKGRR